MKPGREYVVGRKDCSLLINHKRVSRKHLVFSVGEYKEEDVVSCGSFDIRTLLISPHSSVCYRKAQINFHH